MIFVTLFRQVDEHVLHPNFRRGDATPPQVIVTRSHGREARGPLRRSVDQRAAREQRESQRMPFPTSLDVDFLSLFASCAIFLVFRSCEKASQGPSSDRNIFSTCHSLCRFNEHHMTCPTGWAPGFTLVAGCWAAELSPYLGIARLYINKPSADFRVPFFAGSRPVAALPFAVCARRGIMPWSPQKLRTRALSPQWRVPKPFHLSRKSRQQLEASSEHFLGPIS
eukprot:s1078_g6.t1